MTKREYAYIMRRRRELPERIEAARRKLAHLMAEAARYGMEDLINV